MGRNPAQNLNTNPQSRKSCAFGDMSTYMDYCQQLLQPQISLCLVQIQESKTIPLHSALSRSYSKQVYLCNIWERSQTKKKGFLLSVLCPFLGTTESGSKRCCEHEERDAKLAQQTRKGEPVPKSTKASPCVSSPRLCPLPFLPSLLQINLYEFNYNHLGFPMLAVE